MFNTLICLLVLLLFPLFSKSAFSDGYQINPLRISNQSPILQLFGLPRDTRPSVVREGALEAALTLDVSSNFRYSAHGNESLILDGETYRNTLTFIYGLAPGWEIGIAIPFISHSGGFLDGMIVGWHDFFHLPQGDRDKVAKNRFEYSYTKGGVQQFRLNSASSGIGDVMLTAGYSLNGHTFSENSSTLALKGIIKIPSGDSSMLRGSGGTDLQIQLCGGITEKSRWGRVDMYGSAGALLMTRGKILAEQQNTLAGTATAGIAWQPMKFLTFNLQLGSNTPVYRKTSINELSGIPLMLIIGGSAKLPGDYLLDIGVAEDLLVGTAPDVSMHFGIRKKF